MGKDQPMREKCLAAKKARQMGTVLSLFVLILSCTGTWGCSKEGDSLPAPETRSGFETPAELLHYVNSLITSSPSDMAGLRAILFIENDRQRRLASIEEQIQPYLQLEHAVWARFGEGIAIEASASPLAPMPPAVLIEQSEHRATAITYAEGEPFELHMVKIGDQWHLSGYTLEGISGEFDDIDERATSMEASIRRLDPAVRAVTDRLQLGEYENIEQVRMDWQAILHEQR